MYRRGLSKSSTTPAVSLFQSGLTMIELLIVTAIIGLLVVLAMTALPQQLSKARDGKRKSDLQDIKIAFENYYSDNDCYPSPEILDNCGGDELSPYLGTIPCDPQNKQKYLYAPQAGSCPSYYRIFADLESEVDPVTTELNCQTAEGCGAYRFATQYYPEVSVSQAVKYNYGVAEGVPVSAGDRVGVPGGATEGWCCSAPGQPCDLFDSGSGVCGGLFVGGTGPEQQSYCDTICVNSLTP